MRKYIIISDIRMPLMMGDEFLRYMKNNELFKSIPIVMSVSYTHLPSKGWIKEEACPEEIVPSYAVAGASALSILTDEKFFPRRNSGIGR